MGFPRGPTRSSPGGHVRRLPAPTTFGWVLFRPLHIPAGQSVFTCLHLMTPQRASRVSSALPPTPAVRAEREASQGLSAACPSTTWGAGWKEPYHPPTTTTKGDSWGLRSISPQPSVQKVTSLSPEARAAGLEGAASSGSSSSRGSCTERQGHQESDPGTFPREVAAQRARRARSLETRHLRAEGRTQGEPAHPCRGVTLTQDPACCASYYEEPGKAII